MGKIDGTQSGETLRTHKQDSTLHAGGGSDLGFGKRGSDALFGSNGDDTLRGSNGNDTLNGGEGDDTLNGGGHADVMRGGLGDDKLCGSIGNDILNGGIGNDTLNGGQGQDRFYFQAGSGHDRDRINDFSDGDLIVIEEALSVTRIVAVHHDDAMIFLSSGDGILLHNVDADALEISSGGDVIFL